MTRNPTAGKSRISSSYRSFSSSLKGASKARTLLSSLAPLDAGSINAGCISDKARAAPMGNAEEGAMDSTVRAQRLGIRRIDQVIHLDRGGRW